MGRELGGEALEEGGLQPTPWARGRPWRRGTLLRTVHLALQVAGARSHTCVLGPQCPEGAADGQRGRGQGARVSSEQSRGSGSPRTERRGVGVSPLPSSHVVTSPRPLPFPVPPPQHSFPVCLSMCCPPTTHGPGSRCLPTAVDSCCLSGGWAWGVGRAQCGRLLSASPQWGLGGHASFSPSSGRPHRGPHTRPEEEPGLPAPPDQAQPCLDIDVVFFWSKK